MALSVAEVSQLGELAKIALTPAEIEQFAVELNAVLERVVEVSNVNPDIPATYHPLATSNVFRPDEVEISTASKLVLAAAPAVEEDRFRVSRILGEEA
ncbi:MAG: Asp-tRNA(Asn)/Glu-tRNA(Gln) amidotransferase subunit GatC [Propionibacteriaceae bacterium]|nr:Asp-tRNA(Asn)/Glu-tRNA(Gln) amidotransferase subunit GatC [Propionibacteriaceae bacterium]